jgi:rhodanese-related sulfurtransferase/cytochrome c553
MKKIFVLPTLAAAILLQAPVWAADTHPTATIQLASAATATSRAEALSPVESLALGSAMLLEHERDKFEMQQVFRLALYFRPLRRVYDPNPAIVRAGEDPNIEKTYSDRIRTTLGPELLARIDKMNLTRGDMEGYLKNHGKLYGVNWEKTPTFALLEYVVNDFHEQIAPPNTIAAKDKPPYYIASSLLSISGKNPGDGQKLFEGVCAACHGMDGQGRFPPVVMKSYLSLHSDHEHFEIVKGGPPQKPGSPIVMPTFEDKLSKDQIWSIVQYLRTWEKTWTDPRNIRRGEVEARAANVKFYETPEVLAMWKAKNPDVLMLDLQSDIAYRIMGHIPGTLHIRPEEFDAKMKTLPKDKEIVVIDMFGSQGLKPATELAKAGYKAAYLKDGMMDWHISRDYKTEY